MTLSGKRVCVAIPDTILEEQDSLREKTAKLGQVARYCAIFGVDSIRVFQDPRGRGESSFIMRVLEYLETPQYLRRRLFPLSAELKFAGLLPPLRIPSHTAKTPLGSLKSGEYREGFVLPDGLSVDAGLDLPVALRRKETAQRRVTVKITSASTSRVDGITLDRRQVPGYWGFTVETLGMSALLTDQDFPLKVATSRRGDPVGRVARALRMDLRDAAGLMLLFGSPSRGLFETIGKDLKSRVSYVLNLLPEQNVVTMRSEEAILSGLYLFSLLTSAELPPFL